MHISPLNSHWILALEVHTLDIWYGYWEEDNYSSWVDSWHSLMDAPGSFQSIEYNPFDFVQLEKHFLSLLLKALAWIDYSYESWYFDRKLNVSTLILIFPLSYLLKLILDSIISVQHKSGYLQCLSPFPCIYLQPPCYSVPLPNWIALLSSCFPFWDHFLWSNSEEWRVLPQLDD